MSAPPARLRQLHYAPPPAVHRRRWFRRALLLVILVVLAVPCARWGPVAWRQARLLYWQWQCLRYAPPAGQVASAEPLPYGGMTPPFTQAPADPDCLDEFRPFVAGEWPPPRGGPPLGPVVFLHERRTAGGARRLVVLRRTPPGWRQSWDIPLSFTATLIDPAGAWGRPVATTALMADAVPAAFGDGTPGGPSLRLYAGRADPEDESHFTIDYESDGTKGTIDGWLRDRPGDGSTAPGPILELKPGS